MGVHENEFLPVSSIRLNGGTQARAVIDLSFIKPDVLRIFGHWKRP